MLIYLVLKFASTYFFVPLLIGAGLLGTSGDSGVQKVAGWLFVALGVWGGVSGAPYWWYQVATAWERKSYMDQRCKGALERLPASRPVADGVLLVQDHSSPYSSLDPRKLVQPATGGFQRVHSQRPGTWRAVSTFDHAWKPDQQDSLGWVETHEVLESTMRFELSVEDLTSNEDKRNGVQGVELKVIDRTNGSVLARRVQFVQFKNAHHGSFEVSRLCPSPPPEEPACDPNSECTPGWSLAQRALQPRIELEPSKLFHLHRGMPAPREQSCILVSQLLAGPGIQAGDIEWWAAGREGWEDLHLRVRGTSDELVCSEFFWGGRPPPPLRFIDGRLVPLDHLRKQSPPAPPKPLVR
jgi:hypothetical protein